MVTLQRLCRGRLGEIGDMTEMERSTDLSGTVSTNISTILHARISFSLVPLRLNSCRYPSERHGICEALQSVTPNTVILADGRRGSPEFTIMETFSF